MAREQPAKQAADGDQRCSEYNFEEPIKFNLPAFRASQIAEHFVSTHLCPTDVAVHVLPDVSGNASRWTARAPSPKVLAEVNPSAEAATRAAQHEACPEIKHLLLKTSETNYQQLGPIRGEEALRFRSPGSTYE